MRVLILWADDTSENLGVRALGQGSAALVERAWPGTETAFHSFGHRSPILPLGRVRSLVRERVTGARGTKDWFASFDLVLDTRAGDSFADIYGPRRLRMMSAVAEFATESGTPVVMGPQTIGPFETVQGRALARFSMRRARLTMARDSVSAQYAASIGRPVDLLTTDVAFALPVPARTTTRDVVLNISGLLWQPGPHVDWERYRETITRLHAELTAHGRTVSLLAHVIDSAAKLSDNDVPAIDEFRRLTGTDDEVIVPTTLGEVREVVASADVVIGSRMHACLNALSVGTPAIPLAYSRKFAPLLGDLGWTRTVDLRTDPNPVGAVLALLGSAELVPETERVVARANALLDEAADLLRSAR